MKTIVGKEKFRKIEVAFDLIILFSYFFIMTNYAVYKRIFKSQLKIEHKLPFYLDGNQILLLPGIVKVLCSADICDRQTDITVV